MPGTALHTLAAAPARAAVRADSDTARLLRVLVHRPGRELASVRPGTAADMLFDGPVSVGEARAEHDELVAVLRGAGVEVQYVDRLLTEALAVDAEGEPAPAARRARSAITGVPERTVRGSFGRLSGAGWRRPPLPNLMFTRDLMVVAGTGLHVSRPVCAARRGEAEVARRLARHPSLAPDVRLSDGDLGVEGGDVVLAGNGVVVIGVGPRTSLPAAGALAGRLLEAGIARRVLAAVLPDGGPFHLDLALTMVGPDTVLADPAVIDRTRTLRLQRAGAPRPGGPLIEELADALGASRLRVVAAGDSGHGRHWDRGANVLALDEDVVVAYADNVVTNRRLARAGVEVLGVPGAALGRGRGGPRCLTCPLERAPAR